MCGTIESMTGSPIIFTAAGSGGHIFAALATLKAFKKKYPTLARDLLFVGSTLTMEGEKHQLPMEERICMRLGVPFQKIRMGKLQRVFSFRALKNFLMIFVGFYDAFKLIKKIKPSVIAAFGGYVSLPMVVVGKFLKVKTVIHEQTSSIGLTNKILQSFADVIAVTYETSTLHFKKPVLVVGSPTMEHIYAIEDYDHLIAYCNREHSKLLEEKEYLAKLKWLVDMKKKRPVILLSGGSQGSHLLNQQMQAILPQLLEKYVVYLQVGENEWYNDYQVITEYVKTLPVDLAQYCIVRRFMHEEYGFLMRQADLFIGRSGANTVYQVGMNGLYSIFVPIPWVTRNEQYTNALILQEKGMATIIEQDKCTPTVLFDKIEEYFGNYKENKSRKVAQFALDADVKLASEISKLAV